MVGVLGWGMDHPGLVLTAESGFCDGEGPSLDQFLPLLLSVCFFPFKMNLHKVILRLSQAFLIGDSVSRHLNYFL